jgi:hypothetical protein
VEAATCRVPTSYKSYGRLGVVRRRVLAKVERKWEARIAAVTLHYRCRNSIAIEFERADECGYKWGGENWDLTRSFGRSDVNAK